MRTGMNKTAYIVTTIQNPTPALNTLHDLAMESGAKLVIAGDMKTPADFHLKGAEYLSPRVQQEKFPALAQALPWNHYTRKNLAYLAAVAEGTETIRETDDDNTPMPVFTSLPKEEYPVCRIDRNDTWINIYQAYTPEPVWPRGYSLKQASSHNPEPYPLSSPVMEKGLILQGLVDGHPDIDALYRIVKGNIRIHFGQQLMIKLRPGQWCPFNSQNTLFEYPVFPLLYLPSGCTFRLTDIWRSFVAQRCLWEMGEGVVFHYPTMVQDRNEHDFYKDFVEEMPGYQLHDSLVETLAALSLGPNLMQNVLSCYKALVSGGFLPAGELNILDLWLNELSKIWNWDK